MSIRYNSISCYRLREMSRSNLVSPFSSNCMFSSCRFSKSVVDCSRSFKLSSLRWKRVASLVLTEESSVGLTSPGTDVFKLTYLELSDLPEIDLDCVLITQSLDDHCHLKTLKPLSKLLPKIEVIATANAKSLLHPLFSNVIYLEPGETSEIEAKNGSTVRTKATAGPVLGPPWQRPENGYLIIDPKKQLTLYYEPHCVYDKNFLDNIEAHIVVTPVIKQMLPYFTLVSGQEDAIQLVKLLKAKIYYQSSYLT